MVPALPTSFRRLLDGDALAIGAHRWRCHVGCGHSPEHMSLHCEELGVLISGDMVLPRISTNVGVQEIEPEADPLALYLASIARMKALPAATLVLPSHGRPFTGLHTRIDQLTAHHGERFAAVVVACREAPRHAAGLLPLLFRRPLDLHSRLSRWANRSRTFTRCGCAARSCAGSAATASIVSPPRTDFTNRAARRE